MVLWAAACPHCPNGSSRDLVAAPEGATPQPRQADALRCWSCDGAIPLPPPRGWVRVLDVGGLRVSRRA